MFRRQGIARVRIKQLLAGLSGQHVYLFSGDQVKSYQIVSFLERPTGLEKVVGQWVNS